MLWTGACITSTLLKCLLECFVKLASDVFSYIFFSLFLRVAKNGAMAFIFGVSLVFDSTKIQKLLVIFLYKFQNLISHWHCLIEFIFIFFCIGYRYCLYVSQYHKVFFSIIISLI